MRSQAPVASNPFAATGALPMQQGQHANGQSQASSSTGPILGRGSELQKLYNMPETMGHDHGGINCMTMGDGKVYTGGRDGCLMVWRGQEVPGSGFQLIQEGQPIVLGSSVCSLHYDPGSKWLFCGLWDGDIQAYCKEPPMECRMKGHRRSVASLTLHSSVLVSGSNDGTVRLWTWNAAGHRFECHGQPMTNPSGAVNVVRVLGDGLWVGAQTGITCFDLNTLQPRGTIASQHPVTAMIELDGFMIATYRNGDVKIFDAAGGEKYCHPSQGEHTSNTSATVMTHPVENKQMLLCGQTMGYVTAYDLPDFRPRGSWVCKHNSDVKALLDVKANGLFVTGGLHSDVMVWAWGKSGGASAPVASPFAAGAAAPLQQAASPFGGGAPGGVPGGDLMMG
eukprot:TRINITY_DN54534_c0_g1_i1.p1 TRINITY_DN54534_c0_g1~~TRINITY_DN54534_c0_g1_i1.p1  ORF type:complete len:394 (+),score=69.87 TRINITY_DN54534_c0_g1_i1:138-1319(+)